jgi:CBS domain containing-hemolysin-like protein
MVLLFGMMIFPFLVFLLLMGAFLISAVYYMGLTVTAIRNEKGIKAVKYAWSVVRAKKGRAICLVAVMMLVNTVANMLLNSVTSSFYILLQFEWLYCFVSALLSVLANLPSVFLAIGVTIYFVNQEQLMQQIPVNVSFQELPEEVDV